MMARRGGEQACYLKRGRTGSISMKKRKNTNNKSTLLLLVIGRGLTYFKREEGRIILKRV